MENRDNVPFLKKTADFERLFNTGSRVFPCSWLVINYLPNPLKRNRFGWTIPKYVGIAVVRNRYKRWCREYIRTNKLDTTKLEIDVNLFFRKKEKNFYSNITYLEFSEAFKKGLRLVEKRMSKGKNEENKH